MYKLFSPYHKNQKGEGEGSLIIVILIICALISAIFWFFKFIRTTKHDRQEKAIKLQIAKDNEQRKLIAEKKEPKGYIYYYQPGITGKEPYKIRRPYFEE